MDSHSTAHNAAVYCVGCILRANAEAAAAALEITSALGGDAAVAAASFNSSRSDGGQHNNRTASSSLAEDLSSRLNFDKKERASR
jgi:hypothetical protein